MYTENQRLKLLLSAEILDEEAKSLQRREATIDILLKNLNSSSEWLQKQAIQLLFFYRDMPLVYSHVKAFHNQLNLESSMFQITEQFLNGTLDVSSILKFRQQQKALDEKVRKIKYELEFEKNGIIDKGNSTFSHLDLLSLKQN